MDKKKMDKKAVGKRIFNIRNSLNLTLEQFGKLDNLKASKSIVLRWENGTSLPNHSRLETIAKLGNMTVNELLYGNPGKDKEELFEGIIKLPRGDVIDLMMRVAKVFEMENDDKIKKEEEKIEITTL